jgi:hypothetical protein
VPYPPACDPHEELPANPPEEVDPKPLALLVALRAVARKRVDSKGRNQPGRPNCDRDLSAPVDWMGQILRAQLVPIWERFLGRAEPEQPGALCPGRSQAGRFARRFRTVHGLLPAWLRRLGE